MSDIHIFGSIDINDQVNFWVMPDPDYGIARASFTESGRLKGDNVQGPVAYGDFVQMRIPMMVKPTVMGDGDQTIALIGLLNAELAKTSTFVVGLDIFVGFVTFDTLISDPIPIPTDDQFAANGIATFDLVINRKSRSRRAPVTVGPASLTTPCVVDLSSMTGEYPTPLDMLFSAPTANDLTELWVAYIPADETAACSWADALSWIIEAESVAWTNGTAAVVAYANPTGGANNAVVTDGNPTMYADFDMAAVPISSYDILARAKASDAGCYMWTSRAGISGLFTPLIELADNGPFATVEMGDVRLPTKAVRGSATDLVRFSFSPATGDSVSADRLFTLPTRWGAWHWKKASGHAYKLERVGEKLFVDDICDMAEVVGSAIEARGGRLLIVAQGTTVAETTHPVDLTYTYTPLFSRWPSTPTAPETYSNLFAPTSLNLAGITKSVVLGDSLTCGMYATIMEAYSFRARLDDWLFDSFGVGPASYDLALSGGPATGLLDDLDTIAAEAADIAFLELGTNDCPAHTIPVFRDAMQQISEAVLLGAPGARIA